MQLSLDQFFRKTENDNMTTAENILV